MIWITHDSGVVAESADLVAVMYAGRIVESGPVEQVSDAPRHPYTRGSSDSMPGATTPGARSHQINGMAPSSAGRPSGCAFRPRCTHAVTRCTEQAPTVTTEGSRSYRCYRPDSAQRISASGGRPIDRRTVHAVNGVHSRFGRREVGCSGG
ncbi:hypothetical protein OY671_009992, partial [Metschnikowia pulcherrima]